jgi:hypothetical protein
MNFRGVLSIKKISNFGALKAVARHNNRESVTENVDMSKTDADLILKGTRDPDYDVRKFLQHHNLTKFRKNGVLAFEVVLSASHLYFYDYDSKGNKSLNKQNTQLWLDAATKWLEETYGAKVVNIIAHVESETTPHLHCVIVPIIRTRYKSGLPNIKLAASKFIGSKILLSNLHSSYGRAMAPLKIMRGVKNSKAKHTSLNDFYKTVNQIQPTLKKHFPKVQTDSFNGNNLAQLVIRLVQKIKQSNSDNIDKDSQLSDLTNENRKLSLLANHLIETGKKMKSMLSGHKQKVDQPSRSPKM